MEIEKVVKFEDTFHPILHIYSDEDFCKAETSNETDKQVEDLESNLAMKIAQIQKVKIPPEIAMP